MSVARRPATRRWAIAAAWAVCCAASWPLTALAQPPVQSVGGPPMMGPTVYELPAPPPSEDPLWSPSPGYTYSGPPSFLPEPTVATDDCGCGISIGPDDAHLYEQMMKAGCGPGEPCNPPTKLSELGLGAEYVPFAMFEIDSARPKNQARLRMDAVYDWEFPDRAEYLYSKTGGGVGPPLVDSYVDFQEYRLYLERGGDKISAFTEISLRSINPDANGNTTGLGDLTAGAKVMLVDTPRLKASMITRFYTPTGYFRRGLGTGHLSMEPGALFQYQLSCTTYVHGELKYWFALPGNPVHAGQVLRYGLGVSHLLYEKPTSDFAIIPTIEVIGFSVLDGQQTAPDGAVLDIDGIGIVNIYPGCRFLLQANTDFGISGGFKVTEQHFFSEMLRADLRIFF